MLQLCHVLLFSLSVLNWLFVVPHQHDVVLVVRSAAFLRALVMTLKVRHSALGMVDDRS